MFLLFCIVFVAQSVTFGAPSCRDLGEHTVLNVISNKDQRANGWIQVSRANGRTSSYMRTGRDFRLASQYYAREYTTADYLKGKDVLDVGTGRGTFVDELNKLKYAKSVIGVDIYLDEKQKSNPELFVEADMANMPFEDNTFDVIFSTWNVLSYHMAIYYHSDFDLGLVKRVLTELKRVLKVGGKIHVSPISKLSGGIDYETQMLNTNLVPILKEIGGLELTRVYEPKNGTPDGNFPVAIEITRLKETP